MQKNWEIVLTTHSSSSSSNSANNICNYRITLTRLSHTPPQSACQLTLHCFGKKKEKKRSTRVLKSSKPELLLSAFSQSKLAKLAELQKNGSYGSLIKPVHSPFTITLLLWKLTENLFFFNSKIFQVFLLNFSCAILFLYPFLSPPMSHHQHRFNFV